MSVGQSAYAQSQLQQGEKLMKKIMSADESNNFNSLSPAEQSEYVSGFLDNIKEWKRAYRNNDGGGVNGPLPPIPPAPDDGLRHWSPNKQSNNNSRGQSTRKYIFDKTQQAQNDADKAIQDANKAQQKSQQGDAQSAAEAAQKAAESADNAANSAQDAANAATRTAKASGNSNDIQNAKNAQKAADHARDFADKAQQAADAATSTANSGDDNRAMEKAQQAAELTKQAANAAKQATDAANNVGNQTSGVEQASNGAQQANDAYSRIQNAQKNGDFQTAADELNNALENAKNGTKNVVNNAQQKGTITEGGGDAFENAKNAIKDAEKAAENLQKVLRDPNSSKQDIMDAVKQAMEAAQKAAEAAKDLDDVIDPASKTQNTHSQRNMPKLGQAKQVPTKKSIDMNKDFTFGAGNDLLNDQDMFEKAKKIAERAGQPVDQDDYQDPSKTAAKKFEESRRLLKEWQGPKAGNGNSPVDLVETLDKLFAPTIDWKDTLRDFFQAKENINIDHRFPRKYLGLDPSHPKYKGRYIKSQEKYTEKRSGIADIFFLVDASGSMGFVCGDGVNVFEHIMSELIQLEMEFKIKKSAYAPFNVGEIHEDDVITWTDNDASDEGSIVEYLPLPKSDGGTSAMDGVKSINKLDMIYDPEQTLLLIITDGGDDYTQMKKIMSTDQLDNTVFVITATGDDYLEGKKKELIKYGISADHIVTVNVKTQWK